MNFSKFRQTGELSDITVVVDETEFCLHKFPLYARSDFFCALAKSPGTDRNRVELKEFPGGAEAFGVVADFCYNMKLDLTKTNIVHIRCAAEVLQMTGLGNLAEIADNFLQDTVTSAKMCGSTSIIAALLFSCTTAAAIAEKIDIVTLCCEALIECWKKPPAKFNSPSSFKKVAERTEESINYLLEVPVTWLVKLINIARTRKVQNYILAETAIKYITTFIDKVDREEKGLSVHKQNKDDTTNPSPGSKNNKLSDHNLVLMKNTRPVLETKNKFDKGKAIDAILNELPVEAFAEKCVTTEWISKVLKFATEHGCKCRRTLVRVAGDRLSSLSAEELRIISPSVLREIASESSNGDVTQELKTWQLVENYMNEMARKGVLTAETYKALVTSCPRDSRKSHDSLYGILEYVLTADKNKLTPEQRIELMDTVNCSLLGEATLKRAFETQVVPASYVAKGALAFCAKLKSELETVKNTMMTQEDELQCLRRSKTVTPQMTSLSKNADSSHSSLMELPVSDNTASTNGHHTAAELSLDVLSSLSHQSEPTTEDVLMAARNKLASNVATYNTFRPLPEDPECTLDNDTYYKYERYVRSYDNARNKLSLSSNFQTSHFYPHVM